MNGFSSRFDLSTGHALITVESEREYWGDKALPERVRLTDDMDAHMLLEPSEALALAAALQAVAVHLMENKRALAARSAGKQESRHEGKNDPPETPTTTEGER